MRIATRLHDAVDQIDKHIAVARARYLAAPTRKQIKGSTKDLDRLQDKIETAGILIESINEDIEKYVPEMERYNVDLTITHIEKENKADAA